MKKIIFSNLLLASMFISLFISLGSGMIPANSFAQEPGAEGYKLRVDCGAQGGAGGQDECGFGDFIAQVNKIINFLFYFAVILGTLALIYAGFKLLTAGGNTSKAEEARKIFFKVIVGFLWILCAFLIVHFIIGAFELKDDYSILQK